MKAMILAAGVGSRLGALTANTPKCLIDINGTPMLRLVAQNLADAGVSEVIINIHHQAEQVTKYASRSLSDLFKNIEFSFEAELLGTGGGLKAAAPFFAGEERFLLVNADIFSNYSLKNLIIPLLESEEILGSLAVMERLDSSYLEFNEQGNFCGWLGADKKPQNGNTAQAFCGQQALSRRIFDYLNIEVRKSFSIIETYMQAFHAGERLVPQSLGRSVWFDMGTPAQLGKLREYLAL